MREILFKAKRIDNGEWVEGTPIFDYRDEQWRIITQLDYSTGTCITSDSSPRVIAKTICQFTGLYDKNGKKIWENDIVIYDNSPYIAYCEPHKGQIIHRHGCLCFKYWLYGSITYKSFLTDDFFEKKCEVIGNIFDNADLVKG